MEQTLCRRRDNPQDTTAKRVIQKQPIYDYAILTGEMKNFYQD